MTAECAIAQGISPNVLLRTRIISFQGSRPLADASSSARACQRAAVKVARCLSPTFPPTPLLQSVVRVSPSSQILVRTWLPWVPKLHLKLGSATIFKRSSPCVPNFGVCILQSFHGGSRKLGARDSLRAIFAGSLGTTRAVRHKQPTSLLDAE